MRTQRHLLVLGACTALVLFLAGPNAGPLRAQPSAALTGQVTSTEEGAMEGVLVSAKKVGSTITITVVTDQQGRYRFPAAKLPPGRYALAIRAVGYELDGPTAVDVGAQQSAGVDLKLRRTRDLAAQLTNAEWILSMPGRGRRTSAASSSTTRRRPSRSGSAATTARRSSSWSRSTDGPGPICGPDRDPTT